jgi:surfeit locus 1 family protein
MNEKPLPQNEKPPVDEKPIGLEFRFDWKVTLLALVLLPVTVSLGQWQLRRADEKRALIAERAEHQALPPVPLNQLPQEQSQLRYRRVALTGSFDAAHCFLLDNQVHQGHVGYEIICPFADQAAAQRVLVSRGFIAAPSLRTQLPAIPAVAAPVNIYGEVYLPTGEQVLLADLQAAGSWPRVVQSAAVDYLKSQLDASQGNSFYPWIVRLDADSPAVLERHWQVVNLSPEMHTGYAVQWLAMAATLVLIGIGANTTLVPWLKHRKHRI